MNSWVMVIFASNVYISFTLLINVILRRNEIKVRLRSMTFGRFGMAYLYATTY